MRKTSTGSVVRSGLASESMWLAAVLIALSGVTGCKPRMNEYKPPPPPEVTVAHPVRKTVTRYLDYTGTTEAYEVVELRARVPGFLEKVSFKPGAEVKKGDLLFVIDPREYEAEARKAEADVADREAALRLAEVTLHRVNVVDKAAAGTPQETDQAVADRDKAKAQLELARAALAKAHLNVEFTQVRAPIDGRITKNLVDVGNLVGAGGQPTALAVIESNRPLYVSVDVGESDVLLIRRARMAQQPDAEPGQVTPGEWRRVELATADSTEYNVHGRIDYVDPALNAQSGTLRVRCRFENEDGVLLPGLFVRMRLLLDEAEQTVVPDIALLTDQSGRFAFVVNDQGVVEVRRVKIGSLDGALRVVTEGLSPTDRVIVNGLQRARPGITVTAKEQDAAAQDAPAADAANK
ncbi:MAG: efflux RND transporter periplasmic adaptor subunit [Phycisphaeraceae bacterium]|nr:efflux RND transporter periplasmic adaptor subunit [Phycisphaeraceae bacterium]